MPAAVLPDLGFRLNLKLVLYFVANSLIDPFDPKKEVHDEMLEFSKKVKSELGDTLSFEYLTYDKYGHVPYPSFYDGLKFVLENRK